jgi:DNA-directed RNA polymerase subunit beta'
MEIEDRDEREYLIPATARLRVQSGDYVHAGQALTEGPLNPQDILRIQGSEAVQLYLVEEVQKVYRSQGVSINDKHIEVIIRQMLRRVRIDTPGDTALLPGELVDRFKFEEINAKILAEGGEPATAQPVLLGVTKASLNTESFLAAASFQETTRVLTEAAITGAVDRLQGLKENVIIGKLVPARAAIEVEELPKPKELGAGDFFADGDEGESRLGMLDRKIEAGFGDLSEEEEDLLDIEDLLAGDTDDILAEDAAEPADPVAEADVDEEEEAAPEEEEPPLSALQEDSEE